MSAIEWTDRTWNPVTGCDRVSPGCTNCYALTMAKRLKLMGQPHYQADGDPRTSGPGFALTVHPDTLDAPLHWRKPAKVFVNSMSDLFHKDVPEAFIAHVFGVMARAQQHTFQILTKRPQRMAGLMAPEGLDAVKTCGWWGGQFFGRWPLPNVHLGVSIESDRYTYRADHLRATPAAVRWLSLEPLLGPLPSLDLTGIDWVVVGGESGHGARPMHPDWVRDIRDRCIAAGIPFLFKQWGAWGRGTPGDSVLLDDGRLVPDGTRLGWDHLAHPVYVRNVGKKAAGRTLDGRTWDEYPS